MGMPARKRKSKPGEETELLRVSHLPHGFYEEELRHYLTQFGPVTAVRVVRSTKTGRAKGWAFVRFRNSGVASIAAEAMNNYLMFDHLLKTKVITCRRNWAYRLLATDKLEQPKTTVPALPSESKLLRIMKRRQKQVSKKKELLQTLGFNWDITIPDPVNPADTPQDSGKMEIKEEEVDPAPKRRRRSLRQKDCEECEMAVSSSSPRRKALKGIDSAPVLLVDASDDEITFKTPPCVKKVIKKKRTPPSRTVKR